MTMLTRIRLTSLFAPAVVLLFTGCFKLSREAPPVRHYVLSNGSQPSAVASTVTPAAAANAAATPRATR